MQEGGSEKTMWIDRISSLTSTGSTRKAGRDLKVGLCLTCLVFSLTACAQQSDMVKQSDLVKVEKGLAGKITKLDQEKKALAQVLKQANQDIAEARTALEQQKAELNDEIIKARAQLNDEILKARAQLNSMVGSLREETLPKAVGDLETQLHQASKNLETALEQQGEKVNALKERREQRDADLSSQIAALGKSLNAARQNLEQALAQQGQKVSAQFAAFQDSLGQFKKALAEVNKRLDQEGKRATSAEAKIRQDFDKRLQAFRVKLDSDTQALKTYLETDVKTTIESINTALHEGNLHLKTDIDAQATRLSELNDKLGTELAGLRQTDTLHGKSLEEVTLSLAKLRDVLGTTGTQLGTKLDSQGKGLEQTATRIEQLQGQYGALAKKLDADLKGLHGYLDKDVRPSLESIAKAFDQEKNRVSQEFIKFKSGLQRVEQTSASNVNQAHTQLEAQAKHVQELGETVAGMREVVDSMAGMLGNRSDHQMNQLGQLTVRLERLEKEQSAEAAKQASNTQAVSTHLNEVTASVQSVGQLFEQFKNLVSARLNEQAARLQAQAQQVSKSLGASSAVPNLQQGLQANVTQLNELTKSVAQLKDVVKAMSNKLGSKVDAHESQLIQANKARKHSLNEVTASVQSVGQSFEQFKNLVSARLNEQAARLQVQAQQASKSLGASSAVPALQQGLKTNVTQLNELTKSVAQLKDVVKAMSNKLGSKVDAHEFQLIQANKARKYSLNEVTASVQSVGQSFEQFKNLVSTRLNEQAVRLQAQAQQASKSLGASSAVPALQQGLEANVTQLNELTKSVAQLKDVVKAMSNKLGSKVDAHESQLIQANKARKYSLNEVTASVQSVGQSFEQFKNLVSARLNEQAARLQVQAQQASKSLGASSAVPALQQGLKTNVTQLNELTKSVAQLKDVVKAMSNKLGSKVDAHEFQLIQANKARKYSLNEVTASVQSVGQLFEQFKNLVSARLNEQAARLQAQAQQASKSLGASSAVPALQQGLQTNVTQLNELTKSVAQLKDVVKAMGNKLGSKVDAHEFQLIQANKARKHSLNEVTASVQSVGQSFEQFKNLVSARLNEQAARLQAQAQQASKSLGASSAVPALQQGLQANVTQLNELTKSVAQLKDVVRAMSNKLGSKVDAHESQLIKVEQALKKLKKPARSKKSR